MSVIRHAYLTAVRKGGREVLWGNVVGWSFVVLLLGLGFPQTIGFVLTLYAHALGGISSPRNVGYNSISNSEVALLKIADYWTDDPADRIEAGLIERRAVLVITDGPEVAKLTQAADDLANGLARAPANALAWSELAVAHLATGNIEQSLLAWRSSIEMADYDPSLNLWRVEIGLQLWLDLNAEDRRLLLGQIIFSWDQDRDRLVNFTRKNKFAAAIVREALDSDAKRLSAYDKARGDH